MPSLSPKAIQMKGVYALLHKMIDRLTRARARLGELLLPEMPVTVAMGNADARTGEHIFVFGVWGRTSTTALQRILNSTGQVCIWGEPGNFILDDLLSLISKFTTKNRGTEAQHRKQALQRAFGAGDHSQNYAMAFPEMEPAIEALRQAFARLFPAVEGVERIGFKEIRVRDERTLHGLRALFPNARFVFLFRDPSTQWPSVKRMHWPETQALDQFLTMYERMAGIYLEFGGLFLENSSLYDRAHVRALVDELKLPGFDERLIGDGVFAEKGKAPLIEGEMQKITASNAWQLYKRMQGISQSKPGQSKPGDTHP